MNKAILMGRLTRDPEVVSPARDNAQKVVRYTLAVNHVLSNAGRENANYFNCVAFGAKADFAERYLHKGTKLLVSGRLQSGTYTNKEGQKVYITEIIIDEQELAESRNSGGALDRSGQGGAR